MIHPMAEVLISFPVEIDLTDAVSANLETNWTTLCTMILENRLMSVMRFKQGDVRSLLLRPILASCAFDRTACSVFCIITWACG
jgi:hypothetical protein